ncbi:MAG: hypothetical protein NTZ48_05660 [Candidatus Omnitrophica bacterium]|nr:hypothetical protein [Candidatus Omnitrophota bacterium]
MNRAEFMQAYRGDDALRESLTPDDRVEIFLGILQGAGDITYELLNELLNDYDVTNMEVVQK